MAFDREDYMAAAAERAREQIQSNRHGLEALSQAAVHIGLLTGDPSWDLYLRYLQAAIEATEAQAGGWAEKVLSPASIDHDLIMQCKIERARCLGRIEAWNAALQLPKDVRENGDRANDLLSRLPGEDAA